VFKRYECGCIGFVLNGGAIDPDAKRIWLVRACDGHHDDPEYCLHYSSGRSSSLAHKTSEKLSDEKIEEIFNALGNLIADGYRFRDLRALLRD
jgi:hypothetical protein